MSKSLKRPCNHSEPTTSKVQKELHYQKKIEPTQNLTADMNSFMSTFEKEYHEHCLVATNFGQISFNHLKKHQAEK